MFSLLSPTENTTYIPFLENTNSTFLKIPSSPFYLKVLQFCPNYLPIKFHF
ncbi:MAG: hypothetical protein MjAS7_0085 [Metallosphaera javensis (ex Sakai et al. 2022)]|nr:MAG: hypothetical protein MjAS7_0085 [Metallosphaera javensis (ex Sakai et al. 2022)]